MSDESSSAIRGLRERLAGNTEDGLGKALSDLLENPLLTGAVGKAFDAREKAAQAQEVAMGALNIPSAADIERLTRRLRSVSQRLEGIEDGVHRLDRALSTEAIEVRLSAIEDQLGMLAKKLGKDPQSTSASKPVARRSPSRRSTAAKSAASAKRAGGSKKAKKG